jgi:glycerate dehydrogenase
MNIVILDAKTLGKDVDLTIFEKFGKVTIYETTTKEETIQRCKDAQILITNKVVIDKNVMYNCKDLKLICVAATGMNNIDLAEAKNRAIEVKNVAGYSTQSVVQHTFSLLLYIMESLSYLDSYVKSSEWTNSNLFTNVQRPYNEIYGKKWGIVGLGTIGKNVADVAKAFGCDVSYYSTSGINDNSEYRRVELKELLKSSDIISIHSPLNEKTNNLIAKDEISLLKNKAIVLNLGRGGIVNESDIATALDERDIYYGSDVTQIEPIPKDNPLMSVENSDRLFITPHIAWASVEARERLVSLIAKNISDFLNH